MRKTRKGDWLTPEERMYKEREQILYNHTRVLGNSNATTLQRVIARENINAINQEFLVKE